MLKDVVNSHAETLSDIPIAKPLNLRIPSQSQRIMEYVRYEQMRAQESREVETFEEADDFELDDEEWFSPYEEIFESAPDPDPPPAPAPEPVPAPPAPGGEPLGGST